MTRQKFSRTMLAVALVLLLVVSLSPVVPALKRDNERTPVYIIRNVFDAATRPSQPQAH